MKKLVLLRHGESQWNLENRFTGWTDVGLTRKGKNEAKIAGLLMKKENIFLIEITIIFKNYLLHLNTFLLLLNL